MNHTTPEKKKRFVITVGVSDRDTLKQAMNTFKIIKIVHECCKDSGNPYTTHLCRGGYYHKNGKLVQEKGMDITLINPKEGTVDAIAEKLCELLHQECVMISEDEIVNYFVTPD